MSPMNERRYLRMRARTTHVYVEDVDKPALEASLSVSSNASTESY